MEKKAVLLLHCADRKGLVAMIADFLLKHGGSILDADQHRDAALGRFFMRIEWSLTDFDLEDERQFHQIFAPIAEQAGFSWAVNYGRRRVPVALMVSRYQHCLVDLLYRHQIGELNCEIALIVSNHEDARPFAEFYHIPFHYLPMTPATKAAVERQQIELMELNHVELVILARYMQVLSPEFVARYPGKIINVHHSFLPAFVGAKPYHAAYRRGVKLIGATSHYVTETLDEGPIIEQDVARISHRDGLETLIEKGRDLERIVLSHAVRWHLEHRISCFGNKTVVFDWGPGIAPNVISSTRDDAIVINKDDKPVAALVGAELFARIRKMRERLDTASKRIADAYAEVPLEEGLAEIDLVAAQERVR